MRTTLLATCRSGCADRDWRTARNLSRDQVKFDEFEARAWQHWEQVPSEYRAGVDGLVIERDAKTHPNHDEIYTLGECVTEDFPSAFGGPETTRSAVVLYYGSFLRLAHDDPQFDWDRELWETISHELQHHLEALATEDTLEDFDYAVDQNFKRLNGEPFDPLFFRAGEPIGNQSFRVEEDVFMELDPGAAANRASWLEFEWEAQHYRIPKPPPLEGVALLRVSGGPQLAHGDFYLALVPHRHPLKQLSDLLRRRGLEVTEGVVAAQLFESHR